MPYMSRNMYTSHKRQLEKRGCLDYIYDVLVSDEADAQV
jgi:hypothetical protein